VKYQDVKNLGWNGSNLWAIYVPDCFRLFPVVPGGAGGVWRGGVWGEYWLV